MKIAVANRKGGVGKSTTAVHVGAMLGMAMNKRVLLVDLDPQGNMATMLGVDYEYSISDVLNGTVKAPEAVIQARDGVFLLASDSRLSHAADVALSRQFDPQHVIGEYLQTIDDQYDLVIIDTAPSLSRLAINALFYAEHVLVPVSMARLSVKALGDVKREVDSLAPRGAGQIRWIVPTFVDYRKRLTTQLTEGLRELFNGLVTPPIRYAAMFDELNGQLAFEVEPKGRGAMDYAVLCGKVLNG